MPVSPGRTQDAILPATLNLVDGGRGYLIIGTGVLTALDILTVKAGVESDPAAPPDLAYGRAVAA